MPSLSPEEWQAFEKLAKEEFGEDIWDDSASPTESLKCALADIADDPSRLGEWWNLFNTGFRSWDELHKTGSEAYDWWLAAVVASTAYATDSRTQDELELVIISPESDKYVNAEITGTVLGYWDHPLPWSGPYSWEDVRNSIILLLNAIDGYDRRAA